MSPTPIYNQQINDFLEWFTSRGRSTEYPLNCSDCPPLECGDCLGIFTPGGPDYVRDNIHELLDTPKCTCYDHIIPQN
jgi:hypothetical protein